MPYEPMSFEAFRQRVLGGRYKTSQAARRAVTLTTWDEETKTSAASFVDQAFSSSGLPTGQPFSAGERGLGLGAAVRNLELLVAAAEIPARVRRSFEEAIAAIREANRREPAAPLLPAPAPRKQASPKVSPSAPSVPEQPPKHDLSKLMEEGAGDDPGEDDEDDEVEGGHQNGKSTEIDADAIARMMTPRPDLEVGLAELEGKATTEKERIAARTFGKLVREQVAKGAFTKK